MFSFKKLILGLLVTFPVLAASPMIWKNGDYGAMLTQKGFGFKDLKTISSVTQDPTSVGLAAPVGSLALFGSGLYIKSTTVDTGWVLNGGSAVVKTPQLPFFGTGDQGSVTILSGSTVTLITDMNYKNLTIEDGGFLKPDSYKILVSGTLNVAGITSSGGIDVRGTAGGTSVSSCSTGVALGSTNRSLGGAIGGGSGGAGGSSGNGVGASTSSCTSGLCVGGRGGGGGRGGASIPFIGGISPVTTGVRAALNLENFRDQNYLFGNVIIKGGFGGVGGGGSAAAVTGQVGPQGGCGGAGGGVVDIRAKTINRATSSVPVILASGGQGGDGATLAGATTGSSGGGGGGGGGWCYIVYQTLTGTSNANFCDLSGGNGGAGNFGNVILAGVTQGGGGGGGQSGYGFALNITDGTYQSVLPISGTTGGVGTTLTGGSAGVGGVTYLGL